MKNDQSKKNAYINPAIIFLLITILGLDLYAQSDSLIKFIFIPHPRSADREVQSVVAEIENIDFTKYDGTMLGGDLTYYTTRDTSTLVYLDDIFDLSNPNTLWSLGNHDLEGGRNLITHFTGRESYYSYNRNGVTFMVLDTELDANSFSSTFIKGDQLQMVKNVCDTIVESSTLILLHHRFMWMIGNDYFIPMLDSMAASSRSMDTTNFYSEIYPLLQKVKNKGIPVHVFGGDRSDLNVVYSPEDSITFYAARLRDDLPGNVNNAIILKYNLQSKELSTDFAALANLPTSILHKPLSVTESFILNQNYPNPFNPTTTISYTLKEPAIVNLTIYNLAGRELATLVNEYQQANVYSISIDAAGFSSGIYIYQLQLDNKISVAKKMILLK
jgi:hypothetical protein